MANDLYRERMERIIGCLRKGSDRRFDTVRTAFRNDLQERGIVTACVRDVGIKVQSTMEVVSMTDEDISSVGRKVERSEKRLRATSPQNEEERSAVLLASRNCFYLASAAREAQRQIEIPKTPSLPNPIPLEL